jgi:uncharacterized protein (DUF427 family)
MLGRDQPATQEREMSLARGAGPLSVEPSGVGNFELRGPAHRLWWEDWPRRVRAIVAGETVADSRRVKILFESGLAPIWYFPQEDLRHDLLEPADHRTHCPFKGEASYWTIHAGDQVLDNAVWGYDEPLDACPPIAGHRALYFDRVDTWLEEDEEVGVHPRDPYHRCDVAASSRAVLVEVEGERVAESTRPLMLFETGLPTRYYLPPEDVRTDLLAPSGKRTGCPYKGTAHYSHVDAGGRRVEDAVWSYAEPYGAVHRIAGHLCFHQEKVTVLVDGEPAPGA